MGCNVRQRLLIVDVLGRALQATQTMREIVRQPIGRLAYNSYVRGHRRRVAVALGGWDTGGSARGKMTRLTGGNNSHFGRWCAN